ncbi:MAG: hypothetical protein LBD75_01690 [Candidatus Peribacteria bacterium]|nr:hypothetical protein [Candidatus Peribacteria bacterium]
MTGTLSPEFTYRNLYDPALRQKLAEIYFTAMNITPAIGDTIFFENIGTGIILAIDQEEGVKKYTLDFNPRETYEPLHYEIKIVKVIKK